MKIFIFWVIFLAAIALQISSGQKLGPVAIALPLCLVMLLSYSPFLPTEQLLFMALVGGLVLDSSGAGLFGYSIVLNILAVIFSKVVLRLGERSQALYQVILAVVIFVVLSAFINLVIIFPALQLKDLGLFGYKTLLQALYAAVLSIVFYYLASYVSENGSDSLNNQFKLNK